MRPDLHVALFEEMTSFPGEPLLAHLADLGVTHIVVHSDGYPAAEWPAIERGIAAASSRLTLEHAEGAGLVYRLHRRLSAGSE
jgi:hypothetical protein